MGSNAELGCVRRYYRPKCPIDRSACQTKKIPNRSQSFPNSPYDLATAAVLHRRLTPPHAAPRLRRHPTRRCLATSASVGRSRRSFATLCGTAAAPRPAAPCCCCLLSHCLPPALMDSEISDEEAAWLAAEEAEAEAGALALVLAVATDGTVRSTNRKTT